MTRCLPILFILSIVFGLQAARAAGPSSGVITIPVVVHVLYHNANENISDAQIQSQLDVLNKDFRGLNEDRSKVPAYFAALAADAGFEFRLATADPRGVATSGITRRYTSIQYFGTDDRIKNTSRGGEDGWDRSQYLNIWIGNLAGGILGYTSTYGGPAEKDGVVIQYTAFGTSGSVNAPFNLGRTATHEIGHWLNLIHIWGDGYCGDDQVDDTPKQRSSTRGLPTGERFSCEANAHGDMYMNFMDLTNDAGMFLFTRGQRERMRMGFEAGGARRSILTSNAFRVTGHATAPDMATPVQAAIIPVAMSVYPNPAHASLTIKLPLEPAGGMHQVVIYSALGQPMMTQMIKGSSITFPVSALPAGLYLVKCDNGMVGKFVRN